MSAVADGLHLTDRQLHRLVVGEHLLIGRRPRNIIEHLDCVLLPRGLAGDPERCANVFPRCSGSAGSTDLAATQQLQLVVAASQLAQRFERVWRQVDGGEQSHAVRLT